MDELVLPICPAEGREGVVEEDVSACKRATSAPHTIIPSRRPFNRIPCSSLLLLPRSLPDAPCHCHVSFSPLPSFTKRGFNTLDTSCQIVFVQQGIPFRLQIADRQPLTTDPTPQLRRSSDCGTMLTGETGATVRRVSTTLNTSPKQHVSVWLL
ncbi:hypothetical protein BLNAU_4807 [Blattamonas nauphoetae]|uniref:Uncharacterized protein n=1 Tax=Blattamonas nauphoetae TaxID=2049346 RepID=A0ABQ9Y992_9EUKA|nr:hypothetical protein BLNAU_4807 [Blattamonas nauphoetae]